MIGEDVTIVILGFRGRQVRVGITAPKSINVYREEIFPSVAPPEPNGDDRRAPHARSLVRGQSYRQEHEENARSPDYETSNSPPQATANADSEY